MPPVKRDAPMKYSNPLGVPAGADDDDDGAPLKYSNPLQAGDESPRKNGSRSPRAGDDEHHHHHFHLPHVHLPHLHLHYTPTPEQVAKMEATFAEVDSDSDGFITRDELSNLMILLEKDVSESMIDGLISRGAALLPASHFDR